jgi:uncharacterized protein (TIGR00106 family)
MPIMEISIVPLGTRNASVSKHVAKAFNILKKQRGIKYELTPMGTIIESASITNLFNVANKMHKTVLSGNIQRVVTTIKIDDRKDKKLTAKGKIMAVKNRLKT